MNYLATPQEVSCALRIILRGATQLNLGLRDNRHKPSGKLRVSGTQLVVELRARRGPRVDSDRVVQMAIVLRETKTFIEVQYMPRFDGLGGTRVARFSKKHARKVGSHALHYHSWRICGRLFYGHATRPSPLIGSDAQL